MQVEAFLKPPLKGAVLQTYGAGHFPTLQPLLDKVSEACQRGVVVVNCSQCPHGTTHTASEVCVCSPLLLIAPVIISNHWQELRELGVVSGADLTVEAALTKLSFLLGQTQLSVQDVRKVFNCLHSVSCHGMYTVPIEPFIELSVCWCSAYGEGLTRGSDC